MGFKRHILSSRPAWLNSVRLLSTKQNKICSYSNPLITEMDIIHQIFDYLLGSHRKQALRKS